MTRIRTAITAKDTKEFNAVAHQGFVFDARDRDGDGLIPREEYIARFGVINLNKHRKLSREEFSCECLHLLDKDWDGQLSNMKQDLTCLTLTRMEKSPGTSPWLLLKLLRAALNWWR